jgi:hypothetical protein
VNHLLHAYGETILRPGNRFGVPLAVGVLAVLAVCCILRALVNDPVNRGPRAGF